MPDCSVNRRFCIALKVRRTSPLFFVDDHAVLAPSFLSSLPFFHLPVLFLIYNSPAAPVCVHQSPCHPGRAAGRPGGRRRKPRPPCIPQERTLKGVMLGRPNEGAQVIGGRVGAVDLFPIPSLPSTHTHTPPLFCLVCSSVPLVCLTQDWPHIPPRCFFSHRKSAALGSVRDRPCLEVGGSPVAPGRA
jgi:hypothetical protein